MFSCICIDGYLGLGQLDMLENNHIEIQLDLFASFLNFPISPGQSTFSHLKRDKRRGTQENLLISRNLRTV